MLLISIFYILLGIIKTRYTVNSKLRDDITESLNGSNALYDIISNLGNRSIGYIKKYNVNLGIPLVQIALTKIYMYVVI